MKSIVTRACFVGVLCAVSICPAIRGQSGDRWQRIISGQDVTVDVDPSSMRFEPDRIVSARFRTTLAKSERLQNDPKTTYKTRVETIQFKRSDGTYRSSAISLLDTHEKIILASQEPNDWKPMRASASRWFGGLRGLYPFHTWDVITYRPVDMQSAGDLDSSDPDKLVGTRIQLGMDYVQVGKRACSSPIYESRKLTDSDFKKLLGASIGSLGFGANPVDVIAFKCESKEWQPNQSLLVNVGPDRMLMLWDGVFLELVYNKPKQFRIPITVQDIREKSIIVTSPE